MSWRIVFVEESEKLLLYLDNLKVISDSKEVLIPLSDINSIMIDNNRTMLSTRLISRCVQENIIIFTTDQKHIPVSITLPLSGNYRASHMLKKQLNWEKSSKDFMWQIIVKYKILYQAKVLQGASVEKNIIERMLKFTKETKPADPMNCEGLAAKMYFRALFGATFVRHNMDVMNIAMDYGYSIVRSQIARAVIAHGLTAQIGIFHRGRTNAFNLVDDIMEPFRPIIDLWIYKNINPDEMFLRKHRISMIRLMTQKVEYKNKKVTLIFAINNVVEKFILAMDDKEKMKDFVYPSIFIYDI